MQQSRYVGFAGARVNKTNSIQTLQKDIEYQKILSFKLRESQLQKETRSRNLVGQIGDFDVQQHIWNTQGFPIVSGRQQALNIRNEEFDANTDVEMLIKENIHTQDQAVIDKLLA